MTAPAQEGVTRRGLIGAGLAGGVALLIGVGIKEGAIINPFREDRDQSFIPSAFVRIAIDGAVTVVLGPSEMGQGIYTTLAAALADELDADWRQVHVEPAQIDPRFGNYFFGGLQLTAASSSVPVFFGTMRTAGATARMMLIQAASQKWKLDPASLRTENSAVIAPSGARLSYGELVGAARSMKPPAPKSVRLKDKSAFKLIGRPVPRAETPAITRGSLQYGIDFDHPDLLTAIVARAPVFGATVKTLADADARNVKGVRGIYRVPSGVAVVADHYWAAHVARDALQIEWNIPAAGQVSSPQLEESYRALAKTSGALAFKLGDAEKQRGAQADSIEADYMVPYLAHAPMEPLNCTVYAHDGVCEVWVGTQYQSLDGEIVSKTLGIKPRDVRLNTMHMGGAFGRRGSPTEDVVLEAVQIVKASGLPNPIKTVWPREDDIKGGFYRPLALSHLEAGLDSNGLPTVWINRIVSQSPMANTEFADLLVHKRIDDTSVAGAKDLPYAIPHQLIELHTPTTGPTVQWMRSVGNTMTCFSVESFIDEIALKADRDPVALRRQLLGSGNPRLLNVLNLAAEKAGWGKPMGKGSGMGIAMQNYWGTYVAQVAEVTVAGDQLTIDRVTAAVDCGQVINPNIAHGQIEGGIIFALSAALFGEITVENGQIQQSNFHDYPMLRLPACPQIDVHFVESNEPPTGVGEVAVPPLAPAVCNAIAAAGGHRVRKLPITGQGFKA